MWRLALTPFLLLATDAMAQEDPAKFIDSVFVERYHVMEDPRNKGSLLVTYRIFVDLADDMHLQMVYGDRRNQLHLTTTTDFYNDTDHGAVFGPNVSANDLGAPFAALDSWLTLGAASSGHWGVPKSMDRDGSILKCPPYPTGGQVSRQEGTMQHIPLCERDGLIAADSVPTVVDFRFAPGYLRDIKGGSIHTMDGAWAVLGGVKGPGPENIVLIGQLTTSGDLAFKLNIQVGLPDGSFRRLVHSDPQGPEEVHHPQLVGGMLR